MRHTLRAIRLASLLLACLISGGLLAGGVWLSATGRLDSKRLLAAAAALTGPLPAPAREVEARPAPAPAAPRTPSPLPAALLGEIERAAEDLRMWEDRIDLLGRDLEPRLLAGGQRAEAQEAERRAWGRMKKALVPLLNELLRSTPGFEPLTEESFTAAIAGEPGAEGAGASLPDIALLLEALRRRESELAGAARSIRSLPPEVLAGIIAASLRPGGGRPGAGAAAGSSQPLSAAEAARLLATLEPARLARVWKALREEDPSQAAVLLALVLRGGNGGEAPRAAGDEEAVRPPGR